MAQCCTKIHERKGVDEAQDRGTWIMTLNVIGKRPKKKKTKKSKPEVSIQEDTRYVELPSLGK